MNSLWLRGILPTMFLVTYVNITSRPLERGSRTYYRDASGGDCSAVALLRRVGVGICKITPTGTLLFGAFCPLPGEIQTVPRGEIYAFFLLPCEAEPMAVIDYVTDNYGFYHAILKGPHFCQNTASCDLYNKYIRKP